MSFVYEQPRGSSADTFAGGVASVADIYAAAREQMLYVDNFNASQAAMERAFDERIGEVFEATGVKLRNPLRALRIGSFPTQEEFLDAADPAGRFQMFLDDAASRVTDQELANRLTRPIDADAIRIARESDERLAHLMESRGGVTKWLGAIGGGIAGAMHDPLQVGTLVIGGGPGAGRTVAARILSAATKEAVVNGVVEAAMQPQVQAWREKAGLDHGLQQALVNVGFAASLGGLFGTAGQGVVEGLRVAGRGLDVAADVAIAETRIAEPVRQAMSGDVAAARQTLPEIREALPAQARGALDHAEMLDHLDVNRPAAVAPERHDLNISTAHRALDDVEAFPGFEPDAAQIARIVNDIAGPDAAPTPVKARSLIGFMIDHGGVAPDPELRAIGADRISQAFRGRLVKDQGSTLDYAREMAAEAGYFDHLYGDPATATARSTIADFLDAIDQETRGNPVFPGGETGAFAARDQAAARAGLEGMVADIARQAGPGVDDALIREAAELAIGENIDAFDALERIFIRQESAEVRTAVKASRSGDPLPGWADEELEAASAARGTEPSVDQGLDDPIRYEEDFAISAADLVEYGDLGIPDDAGNVIPLSAYMDEINREAELVDLIRACRT